MVRTNIRVVIPTLVLSLISFGIAQSPANASVTCPTFSPVTKRPVTEVGPATPSSGWNGLMPLGSWAGCDLSGADLSGMFLNLRIYLTHNWLGLILTSLICHQRI